MSAPLTKTTFLALTDAALSSGAQLLSATGVLPQRIGHDDPVFFAPLKSSLVPQRAASATPTFTRNSVATVMGYAADAVAGASQVLLTVAANEARFRGARRVSQGVWSEVLADGSAIPDAELLGYLAEGARTNLCLRSQEMNLLWQPVNTSVTANTTTAPDGTLTADTLTDNAVAGGHSNQLPIQTYAAATHVLSIFAKAGTASRIMLYGLASDGKGRGFDLSAGTTFAVDTIPSAASYGIEALPGGWFRCWITTVVPATTARIGAVYMVSGTAFSYSGAGSTVYLWGAQMEAASFASTYIATTTAAVTRAADVLTYPAGNFSGTHGTALAEVALTAWDLPTVLATSSNSRFIYQPTNGTRCTIFDGTTVASSSESPAGTSNVGAIQQLASRWDATAATLTAFWNGVPDPTPGAFDGSIGEGLALCVGHRGAGAAPIFGTIRNVKFYDRALTDAQVAAIPTTSLNQTGRARWSHTFTKAATLKGLAVPGNLARHLSTAVDRRAVRCYYSLDGGETRVELTPGQLDYAIAISAGATVTFDADLANADGADPQGWIGGAAVAVVYTETDPRGPAATVAVTAPAAIGVTVTPAPTINVTVRD